jgi:hypothetical protein
MCTLLRSGSALGARKGIAEIARDKVSGGGAARRAPAVRARLYQGVTPIPG